MTISEQRQQDPKARGAMLKYHLHDGEASPPQYDRVVKSLTIDELHHELAAGKGDNGFLEACQAELGRR